MQKEAKKLKALTVMRSLNSRNRNNKANNDIAKKINQLKYPRRQAYFNKNNIYIYSCIAILMCQAELAIGCT